MRTKLELQRDPMWKTLFHKLTPLERGFIIEVSASVRAEAFEDCAKIAEAWMDETVPQRIRDRSPSA